MTDLSHFPEPRRAAVARALTATFGAAALEGAMQLSGGLSGAGVYRIRVGGVAYLLRLDGAANAFGDVGRAYAGWRIAADALLAPRLLYADAADAVCITDFVPARPLIEHPGDGGPLIVELAQLLRELHRTPAFPPMVDYLVGMRELIAAHRDSGILDAAVTAPVLDRYARLVAGYRTRDEDRVSSHNDLNPGNILYDGRRLWLVDWEAAFLADRYVDLATVANWFARDERLETLLLATYFNREPTADERARLALMRLVNHVFYGMIMLNVAAAERPGQRPTQDLAVPSLADLKARMALGEFSLLNWDDRVLYAKARLSAALDGLQGPAFEADLAAAAA